MTARVPPLEPASWPPEMREALAPLSPDGRRHAPPPRDDRHRGLDALGMLAHHPALARAFTTFNGHILWDTTLTPRQRQLLILRVAARRGSSFVWAEHVINARHAGLTEDEIARVVSAPMDRMWDPLERSLLCAVDELVDESVISDETWSVLSSQLDVQQLADLVFTVGCYETTSLFFRSFGLEAADG